MTNREIDIKIHEEVFKQCAHVLFKYAKDNKNSCDDYSHYKCKKCKQPFSGLAYHEGDIICPRYTIDYEAAMELWDKYLDHWEFWWELEGLNDEIRKYNSWYEGGANHKCHKVTGNSLCGVICQAALINLEHKDYE